MSGSLGMGMGGSSFGSTGTFGNIFTGNQPQQIQMGSMSNPFLPSSTMPSQPGNLFGNNPLTTLNPSTQTNLTPTGLFNTTPTPSQSQGNVNLFLIFS